MYDVFFPSFFGRFLQLLARFFVRECRSFPEVLVFVISFYRVFVSNHVCILFVQLVDHILAFKIGITCSKYPSGIASPYFVLFILLYYAHLK